MAYDDSAIGKAILVGGEGGTFLVVHLAEGGEGDIGVVGCVAVATGEVGEAVFVVGQIDVDVGCEHLEGFDAIVTSCIVDDGGVKPAGVKSFYDGGQAVGIVRRGDEADYILCLWQQAGYFVHDGIDADKAWGRAAGADLVVLAVDALKVAVGEEYVADAFGAAEGRFLAFVNANGGSFGLTVGTTKTKCFSTVGGAMVWTESAFHAAKIHFFFGV